MSKSKQLYEEKQIEWLEDKDFLYREAQMPQTQSQEAIGRALADKTNRES